MIKILFLFSFLLLCGGVKLPLKSNEDYLSYDSDYDTEEDLYIDDSKAKDDDNSVEAETIKTQATVFYESIPEEDRLDYIRYQLRKSVLEDFKPGFIYPLLIIKDPKFQEYEEPPEFSENLRKWVAAEFKLSTSELYKLAKFGEICVGTRCMDLNDIGSLCCPF